MKHSLIGAKISLAALCFAASAGAQKISPVQSDLKAFRALEGSDWQLLEDNETGFARMLYGSNLAPAFMPSSDADYFLVARAHLSSAQAMFRMEADTIEESAVNFLPLGLVGSSDKVGVEFRQVVRGVVVRNGWFNMILDMDGKMLAMDNTGLPLASKINTQPTRSLEQAMAYAMQSFGAETGLRGSFIGAGELVIEQELVQENRQGSLAWNVVITSSSDNSVPESYRYLVSADGELRVITRENMIHHAAAPDVGGHVVGRVTPGDGPDLGVYTTVPLPNIKVSSSAGVVFADANGDFNYPGVTGPLKCRFTLRGPYVQVDLATGFDVVNVSVLTGTGNTVTLNKGPIEGSTSQMNAFLHVNLMREWTRSINPSDGMMDFVSIARVNVLNSCNAFYSGLATNYFLAGNGCPNTAYSSVIYHEQGHWQNDRYNSGNGADGFGEGNADVFAMYQTNDSALGRGFFGGNAGLRDGTNTRQFCGDTNIGCYGEVHTDGEVLMGALWKVRDNLQQTHGDQLGGAIADTLHNGWMNGYNQRQIKSIIELQWLILDDNNGALLDGTPNFDDINDAFLAQGFPGRTPATTLGQISLYGQGLSGSNIGAIDSSSYPAANAELDFSLSGFPNSTSAVVFISLNRIEIPSFGGTLLTDIGNQVAMVPVALSAGAGSMSLIVPPGSGGALGYAQALAFDATQFNGVALSNGIQIQIAN